MPRKTPSNSVATFIFFLLLGFAFFFLWTKQFKFDSKTGRDTNNKSGQEMGEIYPLKPIVVELAGRYLEVIGNGDEERPRIGTRKKYLKLAVDLELKREVEAEVLEKQLAQINRAVSEVVSAKRVKDIETVEGKTALCNEMAGKLNDVLKRDVVEKVFFREFIMQ